jgi:cation transport ATPase
MNYYMHTTPGRLRLKNILFKNRNTHDHIKKVLSVLSGIATIELNSTTGSLTIHYNASQIQAKEIVAALQRAGYFDEKKAISNDQYIHTAASKAGQVIGKAALGVFVDKAFEGSALSLLGLLL